MLMSAVPMYAPSFRALSRRLQFMVRRHKFNEDSLLLCRMASYRFFFFFTLVTASRKSSSLQLSDARVYEPQIRARLGNTAHFCRCGRPHSPRNRQNFRGSRLLTPPPCPTARPLSPRGAMREEAVEVRPTPYTLHPTPYTLRHPTPYTLHPTLYTLHTTPYTEWYACCGPLVRPFGGFVCSPLLHVRRPALCRRGGRCGRRRWRSALHPTPYTLRPTPYALHPTPYTLHTAH